MNGQIIKTCIEAPLPPELAIEAAERAVAENPANAPVVRFTRGRRAAPAAVFHGGADRESAGASDARCASAFSAVIRGPAEAPAVRAPMERLRQHQVRLRRRPGRGDPGCVVEDGSWSSIGTDALAVPKALPTITTAGSSGHTGHGVFQGGDPRIRPRAGLHPRASESGGRIPWDKDAVYRYYGGPPNNWSRAQVDLNLFQRYGQNITQFTEFDRQSIMLYRSPTT